MKCALVIPSWSPEDIFSSKTAFSQINYWQPLGTLYVASALLEAGHEVRLINGAFLSQDEVLKETVAFEPGFVGIYSTAFGWKRAQSTALDIRRLLPGAYITAGGPYPVALKDQCLKDAPQFDAVITGEGEITVPELVGRLVEGRTPEGILGVAYRGDDGAVVLNAPRPLITDLDSIPYPARRLLGETDRYLPPPATYKQWPVAVMVTSRGCSRKCIFCFQLDKTRASGVRMRSVQNVMGEIEECVALGYREIKFLDDTFAADYGRAMEMAGEIKARGLDISWFASASVNQVDVPLLRAFKEAGCWAVLFGAESGVQKNLNAIKKGITLAQTERAVSAAKEAGLRVSTPFVFGIPGETFQEGLETIEFALKLDPNMANFHALTPFPGTELYDNVEKYGTLSEDLEDYTYQGAAFVPHTMSREEISELRRIAFKRFYSRPKFLIRRLLMLRNMRDLNTAFKGFKSLFWLWFKKDIFTKGS